MYVIFDNSLPVISLGFTVLDNEPHSHDRPPSVDKPQPYNGSPSVDKPYPHDEPPSVDKPHGSPCGDKPHDGFSYDKLPPDGKALV